MKNRFVQFLSAVMALVAAGAMEEFFPKLLGVGFPWLLMTVQVFASRRSIPSMVALAVSAGAMEDALSSLPIMTSVSYFLAVAVVVRWVDLPKAAAVFTFPFYQLWLQLWVPQLGGGVFGRLLMSLPIGLATAFVVVLISNWIERGAAVDECE